ncbi:hypothetical protein EST38_g4451 [Candolleomyces aberdarensis]|uniref:CxC2-like cysteine cluster KDZ transposase-associated domain-containing protein n=1 Tax=Candolleomyces aberdarensis TaxID=2316362 RepID=A0A4Q2DMY6_9AGAR|nr:hypothetical protein EST38_g4451 [Candolleomyces aberdarensis]
MTSRSKGSKRKKGHVSFYEFPDTESVGPSETQGYEEVHTEFLQQKEGLIETKHTVYVPPSPTKPSATQRQKRVQSPSPPPLDPQPSVKTVVPPVMEEEDEDSGAYPGLWKDDDGSSDEEDGEADNEGDGELKDGPRKKRRRTKGSNPLRVFTEHADMMLDEMLRLEGPGANGLVCSQCSTSTCKNYYRCKDCTIPVLRCKECLLMDHAACFTHRIDYWNGEFYQRTSLRDLGLRVQLGHHPGDPCPRPRSAINDDFVVIDSDGLHRVSIDFCSCHLTTPTAVQLLRARLFPATATDPRTAATFRVLETFQMLSFTVKASAHEFMASIRRRTDNTGLEDVPDRYHEFLRIVHEWRHLRLMKRAGRGLDPSGIKGTKEGECVVLCPACPQPGVNLPDNWDTSDDRWIHALFLAIDANFCLSRKAVANESLDPGLNHGFAYIVDEEKFKTYLADFGSLFTEDKSTCNNHDAIKSASIRGGKGWAVTGLGSVQCSRHDMKRPNGCGDLQKGERYVNMDYFCLATLRHNIPLLLVISYDIVCQWSINFVSRCHKYPPNPILGNPALSIKYLVPKFHLPAHVDKCRTNFSFNLTPHVGRTDGEAPERGWSGSNELAYSTREMGPGSRRDTLDDFFGDTNWDKSTRLASSLVDRAIEAVKIRKVQVSAWQQFARTLPSGLVQEWTAMVQTWEKDSSSQNPFEYEGKLITESTVREELAREEEERVKAGNVEIVHDKVSPSEFILQGLNLEDRIRRHLVKVKGQGQHATSNTLAANKDEATRIRQRFIDWEKLQCLYMPTVTPLRQADGEQGGAASENVQDICLYLPSDIIDKHPCSDRLAKYEFRYRIAQAYSSIRALRGRVVVKTHMVNSKKRYTHGNREITRSNAKIQEESARIAQEASRYRAIRQRLVKLSVVMNDRGWEKTFKVLKDEDLRGLTVQDRVDRVGKQVREKVLGEGYKKLTWIWNVAATSTKGTNDAGGGCELSDEDDTEGLVAHEGHADAGLQGSGDTVKGVEDDSFQEGGWADTDKGGESGDEVSEDDGAAEGDDSQSDIDNGQPYSKDDPALRIEFCHTRARAHRWQEECVLLDEELKRVERFWEWDARRWQAHGDRYRPEHFAVKVGPQEQAYPELAERSHEIAKVLAEGKLAYARRQADIRRRLHTKTVKLRSEVTGLETVRVGGQDIAARVMVECARPPSPQQLPPGH